MNNIEVAVFGAGCFWGVEETFRKLAGVIETEVGYAGGNSDQTTYEEVCTDTTGHAEVVKITYDPSIIKFENLLDVFFNNHNPTTLNRQGVDVGSQYRSVIFYGNEEQKEAGVKAIKELEESGCFKNPIVTKLELLNNYIKAEEYHQKYLKKKGLTSCSL
ncbi:peptide-methionine (S)-S-oxide reductase [Bacteriovorax sp. BAL6_X]|uniref:peptide-methionine (S)-S-oxide reductase MsrA n=1 Tax=Bacteriovorax sp. BAL6_X TaxID=1201290 RepID=UPI0003862BD6|nr:peptide-methionine (S)-S-oxide reductase MsrA [Bacteriovorax sp. BAL6_X]EPZ52161.1 peptide-methionine (S)-S-oxide reductase [Bacteriovorax sp. BAL6_X]